MPTYEYQCRDCGHRFELFQAISARPKRTCPACRRQGLTRLIGTGGAVLFRGSGFYQTDYRSESYRKAAEAESKAAAGDGKAAQKDGATSATSSSSGGSASSRSAQADGASRRKTRSASSRVAD